MGQDRKNRLDSCWDSELQIFAGHVIATVMLNDSSGSLVAPDRRIRAAGPRTVARRPAFIGVVTSLAVATVFADHIHMCALSPARTQAFARNVCQTPFASSAIRKPASSN